MIYRVRLRNREEPRSIDPLQPPEGSKPGDKVFFEGFEGKVADEVLNPKKKVWEKLQVQQNNEL